MGYYRGGQCFNIDPLGILMFGKLADNGDVACADFKCSRSLLQSQPCSETATASFVTATLFFGNLEMENCKSFESV